MKKNSNFRKNFFWTLANFFNFKKFHTFYTFLESAWKTLSYDIKFWGLWLPSVKISFCTFRNLKTLQNFRNFNFFQIFLYILNKWPKYIHLIYNLCRFVQNFQTDNTLSDKIAILTTMFEVTLWRPMTFDQKNKEICVFILSFYLRFWY